MATKSIGIVKLCSSGAQLLIKHCCRHIQSILSSLAPDPPLPPYNGASKREGTRPYWASRAPIACGLSHSNAARADRLACLGIIGRLASPRIIDRLACPRIIDRLACPRTVINKHVRAPAEDLG